jgi:DNA-binding transcriptional LysR family regulator
LSSSEPPDERNVLGLEIRLLEAVVAVADELHFGRAAARLGIAQPPLSARIQRLERLLGVRVFDRDRQGVSVTAPGAEVLAQARRVLAEARSLSRLAAGLQAGTHGSLTIGAVGSAFYQALPELLGSARTQLPDLDLRISEVETPDQVDALLVGELDVGFLRPPVDRRLDARVVWQEPLVVAVPASHRLAERAHFDAEELAAEPVVFFPRDRGPGYWDQVSDVFRSVGVPLAAVAEADHTTTMLGLVALVVGLTVVPQSARALCLAGVRYLPLHPARDLALAVAVLPDSRDRNPAIGAFLQTLGAASAGPDPDE